jgi:hypothetical protein
MKTNRNRLMIKYMPLLLMLCFTSFMWAENESAAGPLPDSRGVYIVTHDQMARWGARNLEDVLARIPGIRMATNSVQSRPTSGPLVSSDSNTRLSASHFSRVLILFNGRPLNKYWHGGADHEWAPGFLEGLKEIRVYTGPAAMAAGGGKGAMDMVIDLVPFTGAEQKGNVVIRLSQSFNEDRLDRSLLHVSTGDRWGEDGHYSVFADMTRRGGFDIRDLPDIGDAGSRMERKDPTFQVGGMLQKGKFNLLARHMSHKHFDPYFIGRHWSATFAEGSGRFKFPGKWDLELTGGVDHNVSTWGAASSAAGEATGDWDEVTETRVMLRAAFKREFKKTCFALGVDYESVKTDGGPERSGDYYSVMNFSNRHDRVGADLRIDGRLSDSLSLRAGVRVEKVRDYEDAAVLPELALFYKKGGTGFGLSFATGRRYMDTWYRVGSNFYNPDSSVASMPYIVGAALKPELNSQVKVFFNREFGASWVFHAAGFIGKYSHLMGLDWDYAIDSQFNRLRAAEVGNYSYWGGMGSLFYRGKDLSIGANVSYHGVMDSDLAFRQLYLSDDGKQPLFLPPVTANIFLDWTLSRHFSFSARLNTSGGTNNGGIDLTSGAFQAAFDRGPFEDTPAYANLDISLRLFNLWKKFEIQLTVHNTFNNHARLPMIEGGTFLSRGREITLTLRRKL